MTFRVTEAHLQAKVDTINKILGFENPTYKTIGALHLSGAYGGTAVHQMCNEFGGVSDLTGGHVTKREVQYFLNGMLSALRITEEK